MFREFHNIYFLGQETSRDYLVTLWVRIIETAPLPFYVRVDYFRFAVIAQHNQSHLESGLKFATFSSRAYFSKPRMYGMTGGRGPVSKSGPRVER